MSAEAAFRFADTAPRYTSYPTAPHFHDGVNDATVRRWMAAVKDGEVVSLYIHVPFCDRLCWFCACHTHHTLRYEPVAAFLETLFREIALTAALLPPSVQVGAVHLGGGSPTLLTPDDLHRLMGMLRETFRFTPDAAISIEIDPTDMDEARLTAIADTGFNRASLGVQDFQMKVQKAINREQSFEDTRAVVEGLRARGVRAINLDLVYGLPHQTVESIAETVAMSLSLRPDRLALFGYAHVPWFKKRQRLIPEAALPGPQERFEQAEAARERLQAQGYAAIGLDHFALPSDSLALAQGAGQLRRSFQGYVLETADALIGVGPSAISTLPQGYAQNAPEPGVWGGAIAEGRLATVRGHSLSEDDRTRGRLIEQIMCDFEADLSPLGGAGACADELAQLAPMLADGMLDLQDDRLILSVEARPFCRLVAMAFDAYALRSVARHSLAV